MRAISFGGTIELPEHKVACLVVLSAELARMSTPAAEAAIRRIVVDAIASFLDAEFLSSNAAAAGESPAGIGNGQQPHVSTGSTLAAVHADLSSMAAKLGSWASPVWVCRPKTFLSLAALDRIRFLPTGPLLSGFPIAYSAASPAQLALLDLGAIHLADDGRSTIGLSEQAALLTDVGESPAGATTVSLWQANLACLRIERYVTWLAAHDSAAVVMAVGNERRRLTHDRQS